MQRVTLVLRGNSKDIMDVVSLALAADLIMSMTQDAPPVPELGVVQQRKSKSRFWDVGQKVKVVNTDAGKYPNCPPVGSTGIVTTVHSQGMKSGVTVAFAEAGKPTKHVRLAGRMLQVVKP